MKKYFLIVFIALISITAFGQGHNHKLKSYPGKMIYCPGSDKVVHRHVPARKVSQLKMTDTEFNVVYNGAIPPAAKTAFEDGVLTILKNLIDTPVPINIALQWATFEGGTLAGASPGSYYSGFDNAPNPDEVYPVALAEKILRREINSPDDADIEISINQNVDWYYDFNNPNGIGNKFDFVSVLLHEVVHGLGFTAVSIVDEPSGQGAIRLFNDNKYAIYTDFLYNVTNRKLSDIEDASLAMARELQGNNLFFRLNSSDERVKIYAPGTFDGGSSISHVDESTYNNTSSSLMTPFSNRGEVERDPGLALDMLYDMGWDMTYLIHAPERGTEDFSIPLDLTMELISDSEIDLNTLALHYSTDGFVTEDIVITPELNETTGLYETTLPAPNTEVTYSYYYTVDNARDITFSNPGQAPTNYFEYVYALDKQVPLISHERVTALSDKVSQLSVVAEITDFFIGIDTAQVTWGINGVEQATVGMTRLPGFGGEGLSDNYEAILVFPNGPLNDGDVLTYNISATDASISVNTSNAPLSGSYSVSVEAVAESVSSYVNDFNVASSDFEGTGFRVNKASGFSNEAINSTHPYAEAGQGNFRNSIYQLKIPIVVSEDNPVIEFDEIVIVEPGEPNTTWTDDEFWDYVVVEGQRLGETEWFPFLDGYDCNANAVWRNQYNSNPNIANEGQYRPRTINMTQRGSFNAGDEIFVRFRLFSDPFANGWGWAIDNLKIQELSTDVDDFVYEENFTIIPNPTPNEIVVNLDLESISDEMTLTLVDLQGRTLYSKALTNKSRRIRETIDLSSIPKGLYLINVSFNDRDVISKKIIKQ